jgi:hypothetical protein
MTVYVADIKGRGVAAFRADSGADAERLVHDRVFRDDLMALASGGLPLWDGVSDIQVRRARPDEEARWRASHANAIRRGDIEKRRAGVGRFSRGAHRHGPPQTLTTSAVRTRARPRGPIWSMIFNREGAALSASTRSASRV